jgi:uncharacterized membrane protein
MNILLTAFVLIAIDSVYLYLIQSMFSKHILNIQGSPLQINYYGAIMCYSLLVLGLHYFILSGKKSVLDAFILGIVIYGVYESTTLAVIKNWPVYLVVLDTLWGGTLFALTTYIVQLLN